MAKARRKVRSQKDVIYIVRGSGPDCFSSNYGIYRNKEMAWEQAKQLWREAIDRDLHDFWVDEEEIP